MKILKIFNLYEIIWFSVLTISAIVVPLIIDVVVLEKGVSWDYSITTIATLTGGISVLLIAKGNIFNVPFGLIEVSLFGTLAIILNYWAATAINFGFVIPIIIATGFTWFRKRSSKAKVIARRLGWKGWLMIIFASIVLAFSIFPLVNLSSNSLEEKILDSLTTTLLLLAMILMMTRFREQWILWIAFNILTIALYSFALANTTGNVTAHATSTIITYIAYLVNSIYGLLNWSKQSKKVQI